MPAEPVSPAALLSVGTGPDELLMADARSILHQQVAPDAGRVTTLMVAPRKPPAPSRA